MSVEEIRKLVGKKQLVIGTERVMKHLRTGGIQKVFMTANAPTAVKEDLQHYAKLEKAETEQLDIQNEELGVICKKTFPISIVGILKAK